VGLEHAQEHPITLREVQPTAAECDASDPRGWSREPDDHLVLNIHLAEELAIEPEAMEFALGQEVGDFGDTSLRIFAEMPDERMVVLVVFKSLQKVRGDDAGGMHDSSGGLSMKPDLRICDDICGNDFRDRAEHVVREGVEIAECIDLCHARSQSPNVSLS
jgi:hypothetical protein